MSDEIYEAEVIDDRPEVLSDVEKLAVAQAIYNKVGEMVSTKKPGNLRDRVNAEHIGLYERTGAKSFDVKLLGNKVGTFSVTTTKPVEPESRVVFNVEDEDAFELWAGANGFIRTSYDWAAINDYFIETGDIPEGCAPRTEMTVGDPGGKVKSTSLRIEPEKVAYSLGASIGDSVAWLLEGGE